jgi:hypothetical protein
MEGRIAGPALWKLLTVKHAMRTLVELLRNEAEETAGQQRQ